MTALLPVRPVPRHFEPLTSFATRLAEANGVTRARILPPWRHDIDVPKTEESALAAFAGLDTDAVSRLTMNRYPLAVRGHGPQRRHGWRLHHTARWTCPSCTDTTGYRHLLWQTALMPVCLRCSCYLVRADAPHLTRMAHQRALQMVTALAEWAETSIDDPRVRTRLYRLRRRCQLLAASVDPEHPDADVDLPPIDIRAARRWGAYPSPEPATVATLLVLAGQRVLLTEHSRASISRPRQAAEFTSADRDRLAWFLTRIRRHVTADGLRPEHVPTCLPAISDELQPPGPGAWLSRARAATALYMTISQATGIDPTPVAALAGLGVTGIPTGPLIGGINAGLGLRVSDAQVLTGGLDLLLARGLVDYQRRRDTLRAVAHLPGPTRRRLHVGDTNRHSGDQLALGWIWTRFTHGPMRSSRWPDLPDRDIHSFDSGLNPESRLVLHETGQQLLADGDLVRVPATLTTTAAATRRFG